MPSQRRRFVEQEVDNKLPSIGYSYLVSLAHSKRFIDAIYTTNFDDLINESFYQFSQVRPIVCAHDSSVNSVSISSSRPKIIKLHGDYLFDDIKSTLRETETLEENIKNKLIEFSKEYGLIVVGYSGNDRSVMDVINYMLKTDDYLKNGIYWCIRESDEINQEVRKLLWKDRVYFVKIDGFDELMAEIHHGVKGDLSLKDNFTDSKKDAIVEYFTEDKYNLYGKSLKIKSDIDKLKKHKHEQDISNLIRELSSNGNNNGRSEISEADFRNLLNLDSLVKSKNYKTAKEQAEKYIETCRDEDLKEQYIKKLVFINDELGEQERAIELCDQMIACDEFNADYIINKAILHKDYTKRCRFLSEEVSKFEHNFSFLNFVATNGLLEYRFSKGKPVFGLDYLIGFADKSLKLEPGLSNSAWIIKLDLIDQKYSGYSSASEGRNKNKIVEDHICKAQSINPDHLGVYKLKFHDVFTGNDYVKVTGIVDELKDLMDSSSRKKREGIADLVFKNCAALNECRNNNGYGKYIADIFDDSRFSSKSIHKKLLILF